MNYRHAYHAGNFADVMKHAALVLVLESLRRKPTPFFALDTHAGIGAYDLGSVAAGKTGEYLGGIARVLDAPDPPAELAPYLDLVRKWNAGGVLAHYPGSPEVVRGLMRPTDRLALVELHPEDVEDLRRRFKGDRRVAVHHLDGYLAAKGLLPPPERRGLVLIDPPFEVRDEVQRLTQALRRARRLWATGTYLVWYPIKDRAPVQRFHDQLRAEGGLPILAAEVLINPDDDPHHLNGSGLLVINPPWQFDTSMAVLLPWLARVLAPGKGSHRLSWVIEEAASTLV